MVASVVGAGVAPACVPVRLDRRSGAPSWPTWWRWGYAPAFSAFRCGHRRFEPGAGFGSYYSRFVVQGRLGGGSGRMAG